MPASDETTRILLRAEQAAEEVRREIGRSGPVSAFAIAAALEMQIHLDRFLGIRGFTSTNAKRIWLRDGDRAARMEHALSHEIGHHRVCDRSLPGSLLERACDHFAACLAMPRSDFLATVRELGASPPALARVWRYSSLEAIARRIGEVMPHMNSAGWLELRPKWRSREPGDALARLELAALGDAYCRARGESVFESSAGIVRVWRTGATPRSAVSVLQAA